jgi:hypothetical protein
MLVVSFKREPGRRNYAPFGTDTTDGNDLVLAVEFSHLYSFALTLTLCFWHCMSRLIPIEKSLKEMRRFFICSVPAPKTVIHLFLDFSEPHDSNSRMTVTFPAAKA